MAPKSSSRPRGGIKVSTVRRPAAHSSPSSSSPSSSATPAKRKSRPSARYRKALASSKPNHGGDFVKDDDAGRQFANRVLEVYAPPTQSEYEAHRKLTLGVQAQRDGDRFQLPKLSTMCLNVISRHFDTHILPLQGKQIGGEGIRSDRPTYSTGLLGFKSAGYDEDKDADFVLGIEESSPKKKRKTSGRAFSARGATVRPLGDDDRRRHEINAQYLRLLPASLTSALQELLERRAPRMLTYDTLSRYFLSEPKVKIAGIFRVLAIVGGVPTKDVVRLWERLVVGSTGQLSAPLKIVQPNAITNLRSLHLQAFTQLTSRQVQPLLSEAKNLERICLRGCVNITSEAVATLVAACGPRLKSANFNWTSIGPTGVEHLICGAPNLEELKIAHVQGLTDGIVPKLLQKATEATVKRGTVPLGKLRKLKLNGTHVGVSGVGSLLKHCGAQLETLDIGDTRVGGSGCIEILLIGLGCTFNRADQASPPWPNAPANRNTALRKINLSRLGIPEIDLLHFMRALPRFEAIRNINLNHIQPLQGGSKSGLTPALIAVFFLFITSHDGGDRAIGEQADDLFSKISIATHSVMSPALLPYTFNGLSLQRFGGTVTSDGTALRKLIRTLDLSGQDLSLLKESSSGYASYRLPDGALLDTIVLDAMDRTGSLNAEEVSLAGCKLPADPHFWPSVGIAGNAQRVDLSNTNISRVAVNNLIGQNPFLEAVDLTGCRSIPVRLRRNYFDHWQESLDDD